LAYREQSAPEKRPRLEADFDALFSTVIGYTALDERITKTRAKKAALASANNSSASARTPYGSKTNLRVNEGQAASR
jgi:hypothetical protein